MAKISGNLEDYKAFNRRQPKAIRRKKKKNEDKLANHVEEDRQRFFRYVKSKGEARVDIRLLENDAGEVVMGNKEMVELNRVFASVEVYFFTVEDTSHMPESPK